MPTKGQKIEDKAYLEMLKNARDKANAVRKAKADEKKRIKLANDIEHQQKVKEADEKIKKIVIKPEVVLDKKKKKKPAPPPESSSESEEESSEEDEPPPVKIKKIVKITPPPPQYQPKPQQQQPKPQQSQQSQQPQPRQLTAQQKNKL